MPSLIQKGEQLVEIDIFDILPPEEGSINIYYGRIGSGKTAIGTKNILSSLKKGNIVYANWNVKWEGFDERKSFKHLLGGVFGFIKNYARMPRENFHFWDFVNQRIDGKPCLPFVEQLAKLTDCDIHLDEGHIPFDSYEATRMSEQKRSAVFATRHFNRALTIYTQRANSVHVNLRGNSNRFFKCEVVRDFNIFGKRFLQFQVTEFQDLTSMGGVDETRVRDPKTGEFLDDYEFAVSSFRYWGSKKLFESYDSKYLRGNLPPSQNNFAEIYYLSWKERVRNLFSRSIKSK